MKNIRVFLSENFQYLEVKFSIYLNRNVFVMGLKNACFLEISIRLEVFLAALFIRVSNRYQKKTIYLLFATG